MSVQSAGLNLNSSYANPNLFGANALASYNTGYEDDLMMPEYLKMSSLNRQSLQQNQNYDQSVFTSAPRQAQTAQEQTLSQQPQIAEETGTQEQKTNVFKILGSVLGFGTPILTAACTKTFSKKLFIKSPLLGIAGFAIGALIDGIFNSSKNTKEAPPA